MPRTKLFWLLLTPLAFACSGGDDGNSDDDGPPPPPPATNFLLDANDPCDGKVPTPTDLFINDDGTTEQADCPLPSDPLEAGIADARRNLGADVDAEISIPVNGTLDALTLSSTVSFTLTSSGSASGLPPVVMLAQTGSASSAADWTVVGAEVRFVDPNIVVRPRNALAEGTFHVVVTTVAIKNGNTPQSNVVVTPAVKLLTGEETITEGAFDGLDAATAARLERERLRLAPIVSLLESGSPPIGRDQIASIQGFTTDPGYGRLERLVELYYQSLEDGVYSFSAENAVVPSPDVFIGVPPAAYANVAEVHYGKLKAPKVLGDDGRIRPNWHLNNEEIEIPFSFSVPVGSMRYPTIVFLPGYGRGKIDVRSLAQEYATGPVAAVMTIDLRCHGDRSPGVDGFCIENRTDQEIDELLDVVPNNNNQELQGADGIPDDSGLGWFPGDGVALRDGQMAAVIEVLHVLRMLRQNGVLQGGLNPAAGNIHIVAHGHMAPIGVLAMAETQDPDQRFTLAMPSGGGSYREMILEGPSPLNGAWIASLPHQITQAESGQYFDFVEENLLSALDLSAAGAKVRQRLVIGTRFERVLLPHGRVPTAVTEPARRALIDQVGVLPTRISQHNGPCDNFFLHSCTLGDPVEWMAEARRQMVTFMDSGGVTVTPPAP